MREDNLTAIQNLGISYEDAVVLRRASMTLRRWFEAECGYSNDYASFSIERDEETGKPYRVVYPHNDTATKRYPVADKETGAIKRIKAILAKYDGLSYYVQSDPRGCALYLIRPGDVPNGEDVSAYYTRGIAVY